MYVAANVPDTLSRASRQAVKGGIAGASAQAINVSVLMGMYTVMKYQYCNGGQFLDVTRKLWAEGGIARFYRGVVPSLLHVPIGRFGDVVANDLALMSLADSGLPTYAKTLCASTTAAAFRVVLMPLDAWKTTKQVEGKDGLRRLIEKTKRHPSALWQGSAGMLSAAWIGHFSWFYTNNWLCEVAPHVDVTGGKHARHAVIGFMSSAVSDCCCNSLKVLKTNRQIAMKPIGYMDAATLIIEKEGYAGFFSRGLKTRLLANGLQGALFTVGWRAISEHMECAADKKC